MSDVRAYLKGKQIHDLLLRIRRKYVSLGRAGGTVTVSIEEARSLSGLLGKTPRGKVALADLDGAFQRNNFSCTLRQAMEAYFGSPIVTRLEHLAQETASWADAMAEVSGMCETSGGEVTPGTLWLQTDAEYLKQQWRQHPDGFAEGARIAASALNRLNEAAGPLPIFANLIAGDPHALDANTLAGRYFQRGLEQLFADAVPEEGTSAETRSAILAAANLAVDDISSAVTAAGILGGPPWLVAARQTGEAIGLPLRSITPGMPIRGYQGQAYVVENPAVFSALLDQIADVPPPARPTIICTSGQLSLAARRLLDSLVQGGTRILYSGDLDVSGLVILRGLMRRHGAAVVPWRMDAEAYGLAFRSGAGELDAARLALLEPDFPHLVAAMKAGGPAFQETLIPYLAADMRSQLRP